MPHFSAREANRSSASAKHWGISSAWEKPAPAISLRLSAALLGKSAALENQYLFAIAAPNAENAAPAPAPLITDTQSSISACNSAAAFSRAACGVATLRSNWSIAWARIWSIVPIWSKCQ